MNANNNNNISFTKIDVKRSYETKDFEPTAQFRDVIDNTSISTLPSKRYGCSCVVNEEANEFYIFGGCDENFTFFDELWSFNLDSQKWNLIDPDSKKPKGRHFHSAVFYNHNIYVFGGKSNGYQNDLYQFSLVSCTWTEIKSASNVPSKRYGHCAVVHQNKMYISGGYDSFGSQCNDLYEYNFDTQTWQRIVVTIPQPSPLPPTPTTTATTPTPTPPSTNGSTPISTSPPKSLSILTASPGPHTQVYQTMTSVPTLHHHSAVVWGGSLYALGGFHQFPIKLYEYRFGKNVSVRTDDEATGVWSEVKTYGKQPTPRWGHRSVAHNGKMYVFGGADSAISYGDFFIYDFETCVWERKVVEGINARYFHSVALCHNKFIVFGGMNTHNFLFNDLKEYHLDKFKELRPDRYEMDFKKLLQGAENLFSDITIVFPLEDNKTIPCHRCVLCARSEQFAAMLTRSGMRESQVGVIRIDYASYDTFYHLVDYLYTNKVSPSMLEGNPTQVCELLKLADQFLLEHLKSVCERALFKFVGMDNAVSLYNMAEQYHAVELREYCFKFMLRYYEDMVVKKSGEPVDDQLVEQLNRYLKL